MYQDEKQFEGLKAVHYVGELSDRLHDRRVYEGEGNQQNQAQWLTEILFCLLRIQFAIEILQSFCNFVTLKEFFINFELVLFSEM